jgi:hypothetical protein
MFDRFTERARKVMGLARQEAQRFGHDYIGTEHILLGLVQEGSGVAAQVLKNLDVEMKKIRHEVEKIVKSGTNTVTMGQLPFTPRAKKVLELALEEAQQLGHNYIGTEHLLLGLIRENEGIAAQVLMNMNVKLEEVREEVLELLGADVTNTPDDDEEEAAPGKSKTPALDAFGRDLTELAREDKLDPVIGARAGHRLRQRPGGPQKQADRGPRPGHDGRGDQVPRAVRGADQGGDDGGPRGQEHHPLHRRAAHPGGRGRRRGRDRRLERAEARSLAR